MPSNHRNTAGDHRSGAPPTDSRPGVIDRAAAVLSAFDAADPELALAEISRRTGLARATTHRLAQELVRHGFMEQPEAGGAYRLGIRLFELGELVPRSRSLSEQAAPLMEDLGEATRLRVHLAVLDGTEVVYVRIAGSGRARVASRAGGRLPAYATGVGKAILAYSSPEVVTRVIEGGLTRITARTITGPGALMRELAVIAENGTAYDREESHLGVSCVASPVFGADRQVVAGLSVTGPTTDVDPRRLGIAVRTAAFTLGRALRGGASVAGERERGPAG